MRLTRRDALAALSAVGAGSLAGCSAPRTGSSADPAPADGDAPELGDDDLETLVALATVLYPGEVDNVAEFVEAYVRPRVRERPEHAADPDPDGDDDERVRYYLVNDLLFGLYASPTGASLAGLENPPGHPGGTSSYQQGPAVTDNRGDQKGPAVTDNRGDQEGPK